MQTKYIFMTGGVCSGLGKGITAASLGRLLKARGYRVTIQKFDPYINMEPGLLSPYQHGEVYITDDGTEVDLDLGHYERYIDESLTQANAVSTGRIYWEVLNAERSGKYLGKTIQIIPHITDAIKARIVHNNQTQIVISEVGGTVGDFESLPFLEAIRQFGDDVGYENAMFVHVTLVPFLDFAGEPKTKPSQHSVKELRSLGIRPDILVCRTQYPLKDEMRAKIAQFCHVRTDCVIENRDADCLYKVPLMLEEENFAGVVCRRLGLDAPAPDLTEWTELVHRPRTTTLRIGLVGKYVEMHDAYLSVSEALKHAGITHNAKVEIDWIHAEKVNDKNAARLLQDLDGILLPAGFGKRGASGLIAAARYARENKKPLLAIGQGMHCAFIEFAHNVASVSDANSIEFEPKTPTPLIVSTEPTPTKATIVPMRKGAKTIKLSAESLLAQAYGQTQISERFRHNYKVDNQQSKTLTKNGLLLTGHSPDGTHVEAIELPRDTHPWYVGVQFCPEFKSRLTRPSPVYEAFLAAAQSIRANT
ncbi:MAG: CTP synthase [Defluviitaleaceae bacterium]|nr:CTP synthase [Defluviitaleaceae bacterium]